jgi:hypothetical protein
MPFVSEKDRSDIIFGIQNGFDYIACSFTRSKEDILEVRKILEEYDATDIRLIAKLENGEGIENLDEILEVAGTTVTLKNTPKADSIKYIYGIESGEIGTAYVAGATASETEFVVGDGGVITLPTSVTSGKIYVEYAYETENAVRVVNRASQFPTAGRLVILAYFRDKCTDKVYSGAVVCPKAKLNPESVELNLTATGKHPFEFTMMRDYCDELNDELFEIILSE